MALEVAEFLWTKFLSSFEEAEAESELSGSIFVSHFRDIKNVVKDIDMVPEPYSYSESISLLYQLNDVLAECRIFARKCKERNKKLTLKMKLLRLKPSTLYFTLKMKAHLKLIKRDLENLRAAVRPPRSAEIGNPLEGPILSSKVFGFDENVKKIEGLLLEGGSSRAGFRGIGVVGIAGVGKTTLVQKILESQRVKDEFNPVIWLPFSGKREEEKEEEFSRFNFETCILDNLGNAVEDKIGIGELLERLNQLLSGKRYLVVLDDVCHRHINVEERLWHGLPKSRSSAVIVTSRSTEVALKVLEENNLILVEPMDREICWRIFQETIKNDEEFSSISSHAQTLEKMEEEIKDQCHGLPLAAKTLAEIIPGQIRHCEMRL